MEKLRKLYELESNKKVAQKIKYALYLYKDLLSDDNNELLDDYTNTLIEIFESKSADGYNRNIANYILEKFYRFLSKNGKTEKTAYDYVKRIERICKEYQHKPGRHSEQTAQ